jgi:GR25 family glycosyltransferase involved in LPS biosynthesis
MFVSNIIYINLDYRTDRRELFEAEMASLLPHSPFTVERFSGIHNDNGIIGCALSHLACIKKARDNGYPYVCIMEDDFTFTVEPEVVVKALERVGALIESGEDLDVIFLAHNIIREEPYVSKDGTTIDYLVRTLEAQTASCYIVNSTYYDKLIGNLEEGTQKLIESYGMLHYCYANDQCWKTLQVVDNWVALTPRMGIQRPSYSDNNKCFADYGL